MASSRSATVGAVTDRQTYTNLRCERPCAGGGLVVLFVLVGLVCWLDARAAALPPLHTATRVTIGTKGCPMKST